MTSSTSTLTEQVLQEMSAPKAIRRESGIRKARENQLKDEAVIQRLNVLATSDPVDYVRGTAIKALAALGEPLPPGLQQDLQKTETARTVLTSLWSKQAMASEKLVSLIVLLLFAISGVLYVLACFLPAIRFEDGWWAGGMLLIFGPFSVLYLNAGWLANGALALAWILIFFKFWRGGALVGVVALLAGLHSFALKKYIGIDSFSAVYVTGYGPGIYLWLASMACVIAAGAVGYLLSRRLQKQDSTVLAGTPVPETQ